MTEKETLLYKYFEKTLSTEEQLRFEKFLDEDKAFREQFEFEKDVQAIVRDAERSTLKEKLQQFELDRIKTDLPKQNFWKPLRIAASLVVLIGASWFIFNSSLFKGTGDLYASNYEKYPNTAYTITRGDTLDNSIERQAFEAYELNNHELAIQYLKELKDKTGLDYVDFYLGQSYLANDDYANAINIFEKISAVNSDYKEEALWYAALAHLKLKQNRKAIVLLEKLVKNEAYKLEEAAELLKKLK